jgi:hypothetical protein
MVADVGERLPKFTPEQAERIKGSHDFYGKVLCGGVLCLTVFFIGLNHYTSKYVANRPLPAVSQSYGEDQGTSVTNTDLNGQLIGPQAASPWLNVVPQGMYDLLNYLNDRYNKPVFLITENGVDVPDENSLSLADALNDTFRVNYYSSYLDSVMRAIDNGVNVRGYFAWSLMVSTTIIFILAADGFMFDRIISSGLMAMRSGLEFIMWISPTA